jgi:ribosomal protein S18 acetylase RimI-like enzyme
MTKRLLKIAALCISLSLVGAATYYYYAPTPVPVISDSVIPFEYARDADTIKQIFTDDRYWLLSTPDYDVDYMLQERAPNKREPRYKGKLIIKVLRENNQLVGFICYYLKNFFLGQVLFVDVKPEFRGKGYAQQLMKHAIADMKKQGATMITLVTRTSNTSAQAVYKKLGFTISFEEDGFVYFELRL